MSKTNTNVGIQFQLKGMRTAQFAMLIDKLPNKTNLEYDINYDFKVDPNQKMVLVLTSLYFRQAKKILCKLETETIFAIREESWVEMETKEDKTLVLPKSLLVHLAHIATGAARGILNSKTENTDLATVILPLINVYEIIKEDIQFHFIDDVV